MADHPVVRADGEALDVPVADHRLPGGRLVEAADLADGLDGPGELGGGGDVAADDAAGDERLGDGLQAFPGGEHVEDDAVDVGVAQVVLASVSLRLSWRSPTVSCQAGWGPPK